MKRVLAAVIVLAGFTTVSNAQSTATATATATIVQPILIEKKVDMNFGNIAVTSTGGTVILDNLNARTKTGGLVFPVTAPGTITSASFDVTGVAAYAYNITYPTGDVTLTNPATQTMIVNAFTSSLGVSGSTTGVLDGTGKQTVTMGATLTVANNQDAGVYTSLTPFNVTVNYN